MNSPHPAPPPPPRRRIGTHTPLGDLWLILVESRLIVVIAIVGVWFLINGVMWLFNSLVWPSYLLVRALDAATGAAALPGAPFVMWALWGGVFGAALGNWLLAPLYGGREMRAMPLILAGLAMVTSGALLWAFAR